MHHLIIGFGYCGYYLARHLTKNGQTVTVLSRHVDPLFALKGLKHVCHDIQQPLIWDTPNTIVYYLIPPIGNEADEGLKHFLAQSRLNASKIIYFGSSGVYGNHQGAWVDEFSSCHTDGLRQQRRLDAEKQWINYSQQQSIPAIILRIAGIYGPSRLPIEAAKAQTPIAFPESASFTNHIYVEDLATIAWQLALNVNSTTRFNIADGNPTPLGTLQQQVATMLLFPQAPYTSWEEVWTNASPMKKEFMKASKRLSIQTLHHHLPLLQLTSLAEGVRLSLISQGFTV